MTAAVKLYRAPPGRPGRKKMLRLTRQHHPVLRALPFKVGGLTDNELAALCAMSPSHTRGRRRELVLLGLAVDSGLTRITAAGVSATVWRLTPAGRKKLKEIQ